MCNPLETSGWALQRMPQSSWALKARLKWKDGPKVEKDLSVNRQGKGESAKPGQEPG